MDKRQKSKNREPSNGPGEEGDRERDLTELFEAVADSEPGSPESERARETIVERNLAVAERIARRFNNRGADLEDLIQVARLGLVEAVNRFDYRRGSDFLAFAIPTIMGEVRRYFRDTGWALHVPRRLQELHLEIGRTADRLLQELKRAPTLSELAIALDVDPSELNEALVAGSAYKTVPIEQNDDRPGKPALQEVIGEDDLALDHIVDSEALRPLIAALPPRERRILSLRFFGEQTQSQIASAVGISQMHVSRLLSQTLNHLRDQLYR